MFDKSFELNEQTLFIVERSLQVGMNAHLSKPVEPEHLFKTLEELIWEREHRGAADANDMNSRI